MIATRRKFLFWLGRAPAIVAASSIMPVVMRREPVWDWNAGVIREIEQPDLIVTESFFRSGVIYDNVMANNALLRRLRAAGNELFSSNDPSVDLIPINRNDGFIRHRVVARTGNA